MRLTKIAIGCKIDKYDIVKRQSYHNFTRQFFMKKSKKNLLTLMLAGAVCGSAIWGAAMLNDPVTTSAAEVTYSITDVFASNNATEVIGSAKQNDSDAKQTTSFSLKKKVFLKWL